LYIESSGEVITESIGIEKNINELNASSFSDKGKRGEDNFRDRRREPPTSVGFSGRGTGDILETEETV
jgi:hypothetical protein